MVEKNLETSGFDSVGEERIARKVSPTLRWSRGCLLALAMGFPLLGVNARGAVSDLTESLLLQKPLTDSWSEVLAATVKAGEPLPDLPEPEKGPPDSTGPASLLRYWRDRRDRNDGPSPSPVVREKILRAVEAEPLAIPEVLDFLPPNEQAAGLIDRLFDRLPDNSAEESEKRREVRAWIYLHSGLRRDEVFQDVWLVNWVSYRYSGNPAPTPRPIRPWEPGGGLPPLDDLAKEFHGSGGSPDPTLHAIQTREPEEALHLFKDLAKSDKAGPAVVAARLLMESSPAETKEPWRQQLITAAANDKFPKEIREIAVNALIHEKWEGREKWLISCLMSENLGNVIWYEPPIAGDRDHWVPILVKLLDSENRSAHDHAVDLLVGFTDITPRVDALRPLLPWLKDSKWSGANEMSRLGLIHNVTEVDLPESVPGLLEVVRGKGEDASNIVCAAESLAHYKAEEAVPSMKASLARCDRFMDVQSIIQAIEDLHGFSDEEVIAALEAYYTAYPDEVELSQLQRDEMAISPLLKIGWFFATNAEKRVNLPELLERRLAVLDKDRPGIARAFRNLLIESPAAAGGDALAEFLADGTVTEKQLLAGLGHRKNPQWKTDGFRDLSSRDGAVRGYAAVLSGRNEEITTVLKSGDGEAVAAVLAASRIAGDALDFTRVVSLLDSEIPKVGNAAHAYLDSRMEPEARQVLKEHYPDAGPAWDAKLHTYGEFTALEQRLRKEFKITGNLQEVVGLIRTIPGGSERERWCFFVYPDDTFAIRDYGYGRAAIRRVPHEILEQVRGYLSRYRVDDLPPLETDTFDGVHYRYQHATASGVRSVFMNNPPTRREEVMRFLKYQPDGKGIVIYARLVNLFKDVFDQLDLKPGFGNGIELVVPRETAEIKSVWKAGDDLRVLVKNSSESRQWQGVSPADGKLTGAVGEPSACAIIEDHADLHLKFEPFSEYHFRAPWRVRKGDATLHSGKFNDVAGLWWCRRGKEPELLAEGTFVEELVSPDGKWCVAAKALGSGWAEPNIVVRINLETREVTSLDLKPADNFDVLAFVPSHGKFLVMRAADSRLSTVAPATGPEKAEYHLLNAATGALEPVTGEFRMISQNQFRPLQATKDPDIVWASQSYYGGNGTKTVVGRYDSRTFTFTPLREIADIYFESVDMWVDENEGKGMIYAAARGDLLKISLSAERQ